MAISAFISLLLILFARMRSGCTARQGSHGMVRVDKQHGGVSRAPVDHLKECSTKKLNVKWEGLGFTLI